MRKRSTIVFLLFLLLGGCGEEDGFNGSNTGSGKPDIDQVINTHGQVKNVSRLDEFVSNVEQAEKDRVQVVSYTTEGDPIYHTLDFDGIAIQFTYDTSKDQYGSGEVSAMACESISKNETGSMVNYVLRSCEQGKTFNVLTLEK